MRQHPTTLILCACASLLLAPAGSYVPSARALQQSPGAADRLSDADLEELLAPIALYPDPLLANVLTAACYPDELAAASKAGGNESTIESANWEPSVKAVAKIPDALSMLTEYPDWTTAIGEAFILQSQDVMAAVQRLRARAYANGALETTEQQVVTTQGDTIIIQPAQPEVIYVPTYQPSVVYVDHYDSGDVVAAGVIGFGLGVATGAIIANNVDCDWWGGGCCYGCGWGHGGDYNGGHNTKVKIDTGGGDINIGNSNNQINNIKNNGNAWKPNNTKLSNNMQQGRPASLNNYKGTGAGRANPNARVPNRAAGSKPIASQRPAPRPSSVNRAATAGGASRANRPAAQPMQRPSSMDRGAAPKAKPSIPPASSRPPAARSGGGSRQQSPAARSSGGGQQRSPSASRPSAYNSSGGSKAASRGASSRGSSAASRGGGGGSRGGGGGGRGGGGRR